MTTVDRVSELVQLKGDRSFFRREDGICINFDSRHYLRIKASQIELNRDTRIDDLSSLAIWLSHDSDINQKGDGSGRTATDLLARVASGAPLLPIERIRSNIITHTAYSEVVSQLSGGAYYRHRPPKLLLAIEGRWPQPISSAPI